METLDCILNSCSNTLSALPTSAQRDQKIAKNVTVRMPSSDLTEFIVVLLHRVPGPCHRHHGRRGGRRHCCPARTSP
jgi:hypothetical protein